jgi:hypothetical protein
MVWLIQVDGLIVDARELPPPIRAQAFDLGVIPYIPAGSRPTGAGRPGHCVSKPPYQG